MTKAFSFLLFIFLFLVGCAPIYNPNAVNSPQFTQKNDAHLQGSVGISGYDIQAAYSPLNKLGIMANISTFENSNNYWSRFYEGGAGYYQTFDENGRLECYGGFGNGQTTLNNNIIGGTINASYNRFFIQPGIGVKQDFIETSFCTRIAYVDVYQLRSNDPNLIPTGAFFVEPVLTGKFGYKYVKAFMQVGLSLTSIKLLSIYSVPLIMNIGMNISFSELYKKKSKS